VARFLVLALAALVLTIATASFALQALGLLPVATIDTHGLRPLTVVAFWAFEAFALLALFLVVHGHFGRWWLDGLVTAWLAWIFRGPLLVLTAVTALGAPPGPWMRAALAWWAVYSVCGLLLGNLARRLVLPSEDEEAAP
jgi:hypothetical protein